MGVEGDRYGVPCPMDGLLRLGSGAFPLVRSIATVQKCNEIKRGVSPRQSSTPSF